MAVLRISILTAALGMGVLVGVPADALQSTAAFKLGTFRQGTRTFVGAVLNDTVVVDLPAADPSLPRDLKAIIAGYDALRSRIAAAVTKAAGGNTTPKGIDVSTLTVLPPVLPSSMLSSYVRPLSVLL